MVTLGSLTMMTVLYFAQLVLRLGDFVNPTFVVDLSRTYSAASFRSSPLLNDRLWLLATMLDYNLATDLHAVAFLVRRRCRVLYL